MTNPSVPDDLEHAARRHQLHLMNLVVFRHPDQHWNFWVRVEARANDLALMGTGESWGDTEAEAVDRAVLRALANALSMDVAYNRTAAVRELERSGSR